MSKYFCKARVHIVLAVSGNEARGVTRTLAGTQTHISDSHGLTGVVVSCMKMGQITFRVGLV